MAVTGSRLSPRSAGLGGLQLQWQQIELSEGRLHVHRVKNGIPASTQSAVTRCGRFVSYAGITRETPIIQRVGETAKMPFPIHPHTCAECSCARGSVVKFTMLGVRFLDADPSLASLNPQAKFIRMMCQEWDSQRAPDSR